MRLSALPAVAVFLLFGVTAEHSRAEDPGWARPPHPSRIEFPPLEFHPSRPERIEFPNGMVVFLSPDHTIPQIRARLMVGAGALCESTGEQGLADLTARVLRLGGTIQVSATEMNRRLEYVGAVLETAAHRDFTGVGLRVLSKDRDLGFELMAGMVRNPAFPEDKIAMRKKEALEELKRQEDDPLEITRREFRKLLYGKEHPYGRDPLGTPETIHRFRREDLIRFHERWYRPDRMILAVAGDFDRDSMLELIDRLFGNWEIRSSSFEYPVPRPQPTGGKVFFLAKDLNQSTVRIGHLGIRRDNPDAIPLEVLNYILGGGGFSSRLVQKVRTERGFAYRVVSVFDEPLLTGQFLTLLQTQTKNTVKATQLALDIIREIIETGNLTDEEIESAKKAKLNDFVFKFETAYDVVSEYAEIEYYGLPPDYLETYRDRLASVTREDLLRVARKYIHPDRMTILILGHESVRTQLGALEGFEVAETTR